jgi:hypothetical protein
MKDDETNDPPPDPSRSPRIERNVIAVGCRKFGRRRRRAASVRQRPPQTGRPR